MAEFEWEGHPEPASLRRSIRHQLRRFDPTIRVIAETFLAETTPIDLLAVGGEGEVISIRIAREADDADALTKSLADLTWLRPRLSDFLKLAPGLGIEPSAEPRAMLFCPQFGQETRAAVEYFPSRSIELLTFQCFRQQGHLSVLFEAWIPPDPRRRAAGELASFEAESRRAESTMERRPPLADAPSRSNFRTGLTDVDLCNDLEEEKILD